MRTPAQNAWRARARAANSAAYQRELAASRRLKEAYRGTCAECGASTSGANGPGSAASLCIRCSARKVSLRRRGTGPVIAKTLRYLSARPRRYHEIRDYLGVSNGYLNQLLNRLLRYGLVERVERGVYRKAAA